MILAGLLVGVLSISTNISSDFRSDDITRSLFDKNLEEFPRAVRMITHEDTTPDHIEKKIRQYMDYQEQITLQYGVEYRSYFLVGVPTDNGFNVTLGNYQSAPLEAVWVRVGDDARNLKTVEEGNITTYDFKTDGRTLDIHINHTENQNTFHTSRKIFSYIDLTIETGETVWRDTQFN